MAVLMGCRSAVRWASLMAERRAVPMAVLMGCWSVVS